MATPQFCDNCTCGRAQAAAAQATTTGAGVAGGVSSDELAAAESFEQIRREARSFTSPADWTEPTEGIEPAVPLRSKIWFNNPNDPGM